MITMITTTTMFHYRLMPEEARYDDSCFMESWAGDEKRRREASLMRSEGSRSSEAGGRQWAAEAAKQNGQIFIEDGTEDGGNALTEEQI